MHKRLFLIWLNVFIYSLVYSQNIYFSKLYNPNNTWSAGMSIINDGSGFICAGISGDPNTGNKDIIILTTDQYGNLLDWNNIGEAGFNYYPGLSGSFNRTSDNGFIIGGAIEGSNRGVGLLMKLDESANVLWEKIYGDTVSPDYSYLSIFQCKETFDRGYILVGEKKPQRAYVDLLLIKTDSLGNVEWEVTFGNENADKGRSVCQTYDHGYIIGGYTYMPGMYYSGDPMIIKVDSSGTFEWQKSFKSDFDDGKAMVCATKDSNILIGLGYATFQPTVEMSSRIIKIIKVTYSGDTLWMKSYGESRMANILMNIKETDDNNFVAVGFSDPDTTTFIWGWMLKINSNGDSIWYRDYRKVTNDLSQNRIHDFTQTDDGGYIGTGYVFPVLEPPYAENIWLLRVDSLGIDSSLWVGIDNSINYEPSKLKVYPNPATDKLIVSFTDPNVENNCSTKKKLVSFYNSSGTQIKEIEISYSQNNIEVTVSSWTSGLYYVVIFVDGKIVAQDKFIVIHLK